LCSAPRTMCSWRDSARRGGGHQAFRNLQRDHGVVLGVDHQQPPFKARQDLPGIAVGPAALAADHGRKSGPNGTS
jgi:hypothetical protein